ncbi:PREDICTED: uncharacterized protein LOC105950378 [Erythranthe guttata]|nr:PREDICTED: uncharacterized protein LOC105950378 [Erythranthe guttata]|eukprot:XP_012829179.1 PREDICTED: uncharacterized protein LOC105950378 [Erythranthe guttata]
MNTITGVASLNETGYFSSGYGGGKCLASAARSVHQIKYAPNPIKACTSNSILSLGLACKRMSVKLNKRDVLDNSRRSCIVRSFVSDQDRTVKVETDQSPCVPDNEKKKSPFLTRGEIFREEFLKRVVPWEEITESLDTFPYYINEHDCSRLLECMASHLKHDKLTRDHGGRLTTSSWRILLKSLPGTGLCRDKLVRALARELQVPLMVLDSSNLPPYNLSRDYSESDDEDTESDSEFEDESNSCCHHEDDSTDVSDDDEDEDDSRNSIETCKKCGSGESEQPKCLLKKGDRVKYDGPNFPIEGSNRLPSVLISQLLQYLSLCFIYLVFFFTNNYAYTLHEVNGDKVSVIFYTIGLTKNEEAEKDEESSKTAVQVWLDVEHVKHDCDAQVHDCYVAMEVLCENASLKRLIGELKATRRSIGYDAYKLFNNIVYMGKPEEQDLLDTFFEQIEKDWRTVISTKNLSEMHKVHIVLFCSKAENVIGWATNHHLSSCISPSVKGERLHLHHDSIQKGILRLKEEEKEPKKPSKSTLEDFASNEFEQEFASSVIRPDEIGVKFDDVGALEHVKKVLNELVILPMKRPNLFSRGNLLRPCKGLLLFGPPGTGKTLIAKALATEAGANFIGLSTASLTSKIYGDDEKLVRALFAFAAKVAPAVIFVDEVDDLLGARGKSSEHEATRRLRNEFMLRWDGLNSKDSQRILVIGATNRPFDLDDAVIRRMPRRVYVGLPNVENRSKILKVLLAKENLEPGFSFDQLAKATDSYSGSDLKNLCAAAAYRPVEELLEQESKGDKVDEGVTLRPLKLDDFIHSKAKVGPSILNNSTSVIKLREWNEKYGEGGRVLEKNNIKKRNKIDVI